MPPGALAQGLQHRLANSPVCVVLIKPGPTDTPMTAALKSRGAPLAPAEDVAAAIVRGIIEGEDTALIAYATWGDGTSITWGDGTDLKWGNQ